MFFCHFLIREANIREVESRIMDKLYVTTLLLICTYFMHVGVFYMKLSQNQSPRRFLLLTYLEILT